MGIEVVRRLPGGVCRLAVAVWLLGLAAPEVALATQVRWMAVDELAAASDVIIDARVTRQRVVARTLFDDKSGGGGVTLSELVVLEGFKGAETGDALSLYQVSGTVDGRPMWIAGMPRFREQERVILFANWHGEHLVIAHMGLGKRLVEGPKGRETVRGDVADLVWVHDHKRTIRPPALSGVPLNQFRAQLRAVLRETIKGEP